MESLLERLQKETPSQQRERSVEALEFFRARVRNIKVSSEAFYRRELGTLNKAKRFLEGRMYTFFYDPKTKEKLPYYDRFPLVLILDINPDGFTGLNLHYLPPRMRISFLDELFKYTNNAEFDESTRLEASWDLLNSITRLRPARACVKRYLTPHIVGQALLIEPQYWDIIAFLPTAQWNKASALDVYRETRNKI